MLDRLRAWFWDFWERTAAVSRPATAAAAAAAAGTPRHIPGSDIPASIADAAALTLTMASAREALAIAVAPDGTLQYSYADSALISGFDIPRVFEMRATILEQETVEEKRDAWVHYAHYVMASANSALAEKAVSLGDAFRFPWSTEFEARESGAAVPLPSAAWRAMLITIAPLVYTTGTSVRSNLINALVGRVDEESWRIFPSWKAPVSNLNEAIARTVASVRDPRIAAFSASVMASVAYLSSLPTNYKVHEIYDRNLVTSAASSAPAADTISGQVNEIVPPLPLSSTVVKMFTNLRDHSTQKFSVSDLAIVREWAMSLSADSDDSGVPTRENFVLEHAIAVGDTAMAAAGTEWKEAPKKHGLNTVFAFGMARTVDVRRPHHPPAQRLTMKILDGYLQRVDIYDHFATAAAGADVARRAKALFAPPDGKTSFFATSLPDAYKGDQFSDLKGAAAHWFVHPVEGPLTPPWKDPEQASTYATYLRSIPRVHGMRVPDTHLAVVVVPQDKLAEVLVDERIAAAPVYIRATLVTTDAATALVCQVAGHRVYVGATTDKMRTDVLEIAQTAFPPGTVRPWSIFAQYGKRAYSTEYGAGFIAMWAVEMLLHSFGAHETATLVKVFQGDVPERTQVLPPLFHYIMHAWLDSRVGE